MRKVLKALYLLPTLFLVSPVFADEEPPRLEGSDIEGFYTRIIDIAFPLAAFVALIFVIQGGYMWIISAGDPSRVKQAQGTLTWAFIGLIMVMLTRAILTLILGAVQ